MPRPTRKTARISENVYAVAPKSSDSTRVHTTSEPSAVNPDNAIAMYTSRAPSAETGGAGGAEASAVITVCGVRAAHEHGKARHDEVQHDGDRCRGRHVVDAKQVEAGEQTSGDRAREVASVEVPEPRHAARRRLHPARDGRQRRAHQQRGGSRQMLGDDGAKDEIDLPGAGDLRVDLPDDRHGEQHDHAEEPDAGLERRVHPQRVR